MIDLSRTFGPPKGHVKAVWSPCIVIRHGINSSAVPFQPLAADLAGRYPQAIIDNSSYAWKDSVLVNGARLADSLFQQRARIAHLVLIGHSMGGLVCRVASVALQQPAHFHNLAPALALNLGYSGMEVQEISNFRFDQQAPLDVHGIVTLATPNSGAILQGQVSFLASLIQAGLNLFPPTRASSIADLTSDRLFQFLKNFSSNCPALTISGSRWNRFSLGSGQLSSFLQTSGLQLEMPHDSVVEDRSVDLASSILPNEITHFGAGPCLHLRAYESCTDVHHTNIYDDPVVRDYLDAFLERT